MPWWLWVSVWRDDVRRRHTHARDRSRALEWCRRQLGLVGVPPLGNAHGLRVRAPVAAQRRHDRHRVLRATLWRASGGVPSRIPRALPRARVQRDGDGGRQSRRDQTRGDPARLGRLAHPVRGRWDHARLQLARRIAGRHPDGLRPVSRRHGGVSLGDRRTPRPRRGRRAHGPPRAPRRPSEGVDLPGLR